MKKILHCKMFGGSNTLPPESERIVDWINSNDKVLVSVDSCYHDGTAAYFYNRDGG